MTITIDDTNPKVIHWHWIHSIKCCLLRGTDKRIATARVSLNISMVLQYSNVSTSNISVILRMCRTSCSMHFYKQTWMQDLYRDRLYTENKWQYTGLRVSLFMPIFPCSIALAHDVNNLHWFKTCVYLEQTQCGQWQFTDSHFIFK